MNSVTGTAADALLAQRVERGDFPLGHHDGGGLGVSGGGGGGVVCFKKQHKVTACMWLDNLHSQQVKCGGNGVLSVFMPAFQLQQACCCLPLVSLGSRLRRKEIAPQPDPNTTTRVRGSPVAVYVSASCNDK